MKVFEQLKKSFPFIAWQFPDGVKEHYIYVKVGVLLRKTMGFYKKSEKFYSILNLDNTDYSDEQIIDGLIESLIKKERY